MEGRPQAGFNESHIAIALLRELLPNAVVRGGSFAGCLPPVGQVRARDRQAVLHVMRRQVVDGLLAEALEEVGAAPFKAPARGPGGDRLGPAGMVGSVSHKGTVVAVATAPRRGLPALGVDIELVDRDDASRLVRLVPSGTVPRDLPKRAGATVVFSAKEAVFKAQYPITSLRLGLDDLKIVWRRGRLGRYEGEVHLLGGLRLTVLSAIAGRWITSVAFVDPPVDP